MSTLSKNKLNTLYRCAVAILVLAAPITAKSDSPTLGTVSLVSADYPPYFGENLLHNGLIAQIVVESFCIAGFETQIEFKPFARAVQDAERGKYDGMIALWHSSEREAHFYFSDPLPHNEIGFFTIKSKDIDVESLANLNQKRLGTVRGYLNPEDLKQAETVAKTDVLNDLTNFKLLFLDRVDYVLTDKNVGTYLIDTHQLTQKEEIIWLEDYVWHVDEYLVFSKSVQDSPSKLEAFNSGLQRLKKSGRYEDVLRLHIGQEDIQLVDFECKLNRN